MRAADSDALRAEGRPAQHHRFGLINGLGFQSVVKAEYRYRHAPRSCRATVPSSAVRSGVPLSPLAALRAVERHTQPHRFGLINGLGFQSVAKAEYRYRQEPRSCRPPMPSSAVMPAVQPLVFGWRCRAGGLHVRHHRFRMFHGLGVWSVCAVLLRPAQGLQSYIASASQVLASALERR